MKNKIIEIGKELIYLSAKYSEYNEAEKNKLLKKFTQYKKDLSSDNSQYSQTVNSFLIDLESDLHSGRKLQIDSIQHDDYLENYFIVKREVNHYNNLIDEKKYIKVFQLIQNKGNREEIENYIHELRIHFSNSIKTVSSENISKNLLIFTLFQKSLVSKALKNLYNYILMLPRNDSLIGEINIMILFHHELIEKIYKQGIIHLQETSYNYFYMKFEINIINGEKVKELKQYNASQLNYRTGNHEYEYRKLLHKIIEF